jgi:cation transport ATPase
MSDINQNNSLLTNLTNKIKYKLFKATYDPDANTYADQQAQEQAQEKTKQEKTKKIDKNSTDSTSDPNKFSMTRLVKNTISSTFKWLFFCLFPFLALMLAMIITNELIVYSVPIRIIFFIFVFVLCLLIPPVSIVLSMFYIFKGGYSYYVNHMTKNPREIMPTIYNLLPISVSKTYDIPWYNPFAYPKSIKSTEQLPKTMEKYIEDLQASFKDFDAVKNLPIFVENLKTIQTNLSKLHSLPIHNNSTNSNENTNALNKNPK